MKNISASYISRSYLSLLLWVTGRAIQAACIIDEVIRREFDLLPDPFTFTLSIWPKGPGMTIRKENGKVRYTGSSVDQAADLLMQVNSPSHGMSLFTFRESTALSASRGRLSTYGDLSYACSIVRILDRVETYLLPRGIAVKAVKRYASPPGKHRRRIRIYFRILFSP